MAKISPVLHTRIRPAISPSGYRFTRNTIVLVHCLILLNPVVAGVDTTAWALSLALAMMIGILFVGIKPKVLREAWIVLVYLALMVVIMLFNMMRHGGTSDPLEYVMLLIFWPALWLVCMARFGRRLAFDVIPALLVLSLIVAIIAFLQYFISPTLWGRLDYNSNSLLWAENKSFEEFSLFFRASSLVGSPQVLGVIMPLAAVVLSMQNSVSLLRKSVAIALMIGAGFTSGSKVSIILILLFVALKIGSYIGANRIPKAMLFALPALLIAIITFFLNLDVAKEWLPALERIIDVQAAIEQETRDSRINRFWISIAQTDPLFGNGYTHMLFSDITGYRAAESYLAKLYFSFGILPVLLFIGVLATSIKRASGPQARMIRIIVIMVFAALLFSTAFESTAFFPFWGLILAGLIHEPALLHKSGNSRGELHPEIRTLT